MAEEHDTWSPSLIDYDVKSALPEGYTMRPLARDDYGKGFFECLKALTWTGDITEARFQQRYDWMKIKGSDWFYNVVIEHEGKLVGTGVVIVERKFIWDMGTCGHIEDISVRKDYQGKHLGLRLIQALTSIAKNVGCCKVILNCSEENEGFYKKCGYVRGSVEMKQVMEGFSDR